MIGVHEVPINSIYPVELTSNMILGKSVCSFWTAFSYLSNARAFFFFALNFLEYASRMLVLSDL